MTACIRHGGHLESTDPRKKGQCAACGRPIPVRHVPVRSREWEELFLDGAARTAGLVPDLWTPKVRDRMDKSERNYGNTWATRPLRELVRELDEEGQDLGGWSALIGQRLYTDLDPELIELVLTRLREIAALGARERLLTNEISELLGLP